MPVGIKARSNQTNDEIDLHVYVGQDFDAERSAWFFWVSISLQNGLSRGKVSLTSRHPEATLNINHNYFAEPQIWKHWPTASNLPCPVLGTNPLAGMLDTDADFSALAGSGRVCVPGWLAA